MEETQDRGSKHPPTQQHHDKLRRALKSPCVLGLLRARSWEGHESSQNSRNAASSSWTFISANGCVTRGDLWALQYTHSGQRAALLPAERLDGTLPGGAVVGTACCGQSRRSGSWRRHIHSSLGTSHVGNSMHGSHRVGSRRCRARAPVS